MHGISKKYYGGTECELVETGQGNKFSRDIWRDTSCLIIKVLENEELGMKFKSKLMELRILISVIAFIDDTD